MPEFIITKYISWATKAGMTKIEKDELMDTGMYNDSDIILKKSAWYVLS